MANGIKKIEQVECSLEIGDVYNVNYSYSMSSGASMQIFLVNDTGIYDTSFISKGEKVKISIGSIIFNLNPVSWSISKKGDSKVISVELVDDFKELDNYYLALTGTLCGKNIYQLGSFVDERTEEEKIADGLDYFGIKDLTTFEDIEYNFKEFVDVLNGIFSVELKVEIDTSIRKNFTGTFKDVLGYWCSYLNYSFYYENGVITIFDISTFEIAFPSAPEDALSVDEYYSIKNTYDKTVCSYVSDEGGELNVNEIEPDEILPESDNVAENDDSDSNEDSNKTLNFTKTLLLYPYEKISEINRINQEANGFIDPVQVVAAQYGKEFWFLFNYFNGTSKEICGFNFYENSIDPESVDVLNGIAANISNFIGAGKGLAFFNEKLFEENFEKYLNYGLNIAGRYYVSNPLSSFNFLDIYKWYNQNEVVSTTAESLQKQSSVNLNPFYVATQKFGDETYAAIENTTFGNYNGLIFNGRRVYVKDEFVRDLSSEFIVPSELIPELTSLYQKIANGDFGSTYISWAGIEQQQYLIYDQLNISNVSVDLAGLFDKEFLKKKYSLFNYRYKTFRTKGLYTTQSKVTEEESGLDSKLSAQDRLEIARQRFADLRARNQSRLAALTGGQTLATGADNPIVVSNTNTIKTTKDSDFIIYYSKFHECFNSSTDKKLFGRKFQLVYPSIDNPVPVFYSKLSDKVISITRDFSYVDKYKDFIKKITRTNEVPLRTLTFTTNYFYENPAESFLANGLVGLSLSITENGLRATYSYSNEILNSEFSESFIEQLEKNMNNSWKRRYVPPREILI